VENAVVVRLDPTSSEVTIQGLGPGCYRTVVSEPLSQTGSIQWLWGRGAQFTHAPLDDWQVGPGDVIVFRDTADGVSRACEAWRPLPEGAYLVAVYLQRRVLLDLTGGLGDKEDQGLAAVLRALTPLLLFVDLQALSQAA
jgi:hypothetical protein